MITLLSGAKKMMIDSVSKKAMEKHNQKMLEKSNQVIPLSMKADEVYCSIILRASTVEQLRDISLSDPRNPGNNRTFDQIIGVLVRSFLDNESRKQV
jgi:hypothetical protein